MSEPAPSRPHWVLRAAALTCALTVAACVVMRANQRGTENTNEPEQPTPAASDLETAGPPDPEVANQADPVPPAFHGSSKFATIDVSTPTGETPTQPEFLFSSKSGRIDLEYVAQHSQVPVDTLLPQLGRPVRPDLLQLLRSTHPHVQEPPGVFFSGSKTLSVSSIPQASTTNEAPTEFLYASKSGRVLVNDPKKKPANQQSTEPKPRK